MYARRMRQRRQVLNHIITLRIAPSTHRLLEDQADILDISVSELIRRYITQILREKDQHGTPST